MTERFRKLKNLLRKNGIETPENKLVLDYLWAAFPDHGRLAEWLHRETRKERFRASALDSLQQVASNLRYAERHRKAAKECKRDGYPSDARRYRESAKSYEDRAKRISKQLEDPAWLREQTLVWTEETVGGQYVYITTDLLDVIEEVLYKRKQRGQEANVMKVDTGTLINEAAEEGMRRKALKAGEILHTFEDGWTIRRIQNSEEARLEGEMLGHCIAQYADKIDRGESHNYSLRDDKGIAHLTLEIKHKRPSIVDFDRIQKECAGIDFACPYCGRGHTKNGCCEICHFNIPDLRAWYTAKTDEDKQAIANAINEKIERKTNAEIESDYEPDHMHYFCPVCASDRLEDRGYDPVNKWYCRNCSSIFWKRGNPWRPFDDDLSKRGRVKAWKFDPDGWLKYLRRFLDQEYVMHDLRDGHAYQIQGKQNVAPQSKYHPYLREWLRSIPYEERPLAKWSAYFTRTDVLHVDDLEFGGAQGEDDFGFKWTNRPFDWDSILNSLHGEPKKWDPNAGAQNHRYAVEKVPGDEVPYIPELGERLFEFIKDKAEHGYLDSVIAAFKGWKTNARMRGLMGEGNALPHKRDIPWNQITCRICGNKDFKPNCCADTQTQTICCVCTALQPIEDYRDQIEEVLGLARPVADEAEEYNYTSYQKDAILHLGGLIETVHDQFCVADYINTEEGKKVNRKRFKFANEYNWGPSSIKIRDLGTNYITTGATINFNVTYDDGMGRDRFDDFARNYRIENRIYGP